MRTIRRHLARTLAWPCRRQGTRGLIAYLSGGLGHSADGSAMQRGQLAVHLLHEVPCKNDRAGPITSFISNCTWNCLALPTMGGCRSL